MRACVLPSRFADSFRIPLEVEDIVGMVRAVYTERVVFHDGDAAIAPGIPGSVMGTPSS